MTFIAVEWDMNHKGHSTQSILRILKKGKFTEVTLISIRLVQTIKKSRMFQDSLKYDPFS